MIVLLIAVSINPATPDLTFNPDVNFNNSFFTWEWVGPEGGKLYHIIVDPQNQNLAFGFSISDLWRTTDGNNWTVIPQFKYREPQFGSFISLNRALVALFDSLYLTTDGGNNWSVVNYDFGDYITAMTEMHGDTQLIVGSTQDGYVVHRTTDGGVNFDSMAEVIGYQDVYAIAYDLDSTIFLGALSPGAVEDTGVILRSTNLGLDWTVVFKASDTLSFYRVEDIELNPQNPRVIFISFGMEEGPVGVLHSSDNGTSWTTYGVDDGLYIPTDVEFRTPDSIVVSSEFRPGIFLGYRSGGGWVFQRVDSNYLSSDLGGSVSSTWYCATCGGVMKSTNNGYNWSDVSSGLKALMTWVSYDNFTAPINDRMYATSVIGNTFYLSTDGGATWGKKGDKNIVWRPAIEVFPGNPSLIYASCLWVDIVGIDTIAYDFLVSTNGGLDWDTVHQAPHPDSAILYSSLHVFPTDQNRLLGRYLAEDMDSEAIFLTTDQGRTWTSVLDDCDGPIVGSDTVFVFNDNRILYSTDQGVSWNTLVSGIPTLCYDYDPDDQCLYIIKDIATDPDSLLRVHLDGTIENISPVDRSIIPPSMDAHGSNYLFISLINQAFPLLMRSEDAGSSFVFDTLGFLPVGIAVSQNEVLLADLGKSFWRSEDAIGIKSEKRSDISSKIKVYPTIFRSEVIFESRTRTPVAGRIYDPLGRLLDSFVIEKKKIWRRSLPAGVYFYEVKIERGRVCGKIIKFD